MRSADIVVIGAGMAGASAAAEILAAAEGVRVLVLEGEARPGYHTTGRSAACFIQNYGNRSIRQFNAASRPILEAHPLAAEVEEAPGSLLSPRGILQLDDGTQGAAFDELLSEGDGVEALDETAVRALVPALRPGSFARAAYEADAMDIDVDRLHQIYLRFLKRAGGELVCDARVTALRREADVWHLETTAGAFEAPVIVNAAGAWADRVAVQAGLSPIGLQPLRRSAALLAPRDGWDVGRWPLTGDLGERWYMRPDAGRMMVSPADADLVEPQDAWPDDMVLAEGLDRFARVFDYEVTRLEASWAGLRTFAPDKSLVIGFDPAAEGFFWLAGQGGYGIQTAPAAARLVAALLLGRDVPPELAALGFEAESAAPARFR
ncbi:NAD(P)/FAD-dependent oxidoreductase [Algihabitans albus]|uniref:NAD(P)/FAD-dependent oxidoreductase n=1 Tax=Algihabitans albus TaxID=2164067 RepID=UPI000E5C9455|nr:FAD-dependent oxidoreductase [Algihabitans albus]